MLAFPSRPAIRGALLGTLTLSAFVQAADPVVIEMKGTPRGEDIWFAPVGMAVEAGTTVRFVNRDSANSHTATLYHPDNHGRPARAPESAAPWNSGFLLPNETFEVSLTEPGVYDYFCLPHEQAGMAGRIVVVKTMAESVAPVAYDDEGIPTRVLETLPEVDDILQAEANYREHAE